MLEDGADDGSVQRPVAAGGPPAEQAAGETFAGEILDAPPIEVEPGVTVGDYLSGFLQGTRRALFEKGRQSITITLERVSPPSVGPPPAICSRPSSRSLSVW